MTWIFRYLFRGDYIQPIDEQKRAEIFLRIRQDRDFMLLLQSLYTRAYQSLSFNWSQGPDDWQQGVYAGRVIELAHLIDMAESADETLATMEKRQAKREMLQKLASRVGLRKNKEVELVDKPL